MFYQKKTINNVPTKIPLSNSAPVGNPIGTIISTYKKIQPRNYLYCDGSTFDETLYPALYLYLGTNVLPDYRECAIVGAEKNTTDVFDSTETDPSTGLPGTQNHDVYTQGQFKDDQLQDHNHIINVETTRIYYNNSTASAGSSLGGLGDSGTRIYAGQRYNKGRVGDTTRGKRKAVYYYIKAVDGVDISDEDTFLNTVKDYVNESLEWTFAGRVFTSGTTKTVPKSSIEIKISVSNTGSIITAPEFTIPIRAITTSDSDEKLTSWQSIGGTSGTFTVSGDNINISITNIGSSYIRIWYR